MTTKYIFKEIPTRHTLRNLKRYGSIKIDSNRHSINLKLIYAKPETMLKIYDDIVKILEKNSLYPIKTHSMIPNGNRRVSYKRSLK